MVVSPPQRVGPDGSAGAVSAARAGRGAQSSCRHHVQEQEQGRAETQGAVVTRLQAACCGDLRLVLRADRGNVRRPGGRRIGRPGQDGRLVVHRHVEGPGDLADPAAERWRASQQGQCLRVGQVKQEAAGFVADGLVGRRSGRDLDEGPCCLRAIQVHVYLAVDRGPPRGRVGAEYSKTSTGAVTGAWTTMASGRNRPSVSVTVTTKGSKTGPLGVAPGSAGASSWECSPGSIPKPSREDTGEGAAVRPQVGSPCGHAIAISPSPTSAPDMESMPCRARGAR